MGKPAEYIPGFKVISQEIQLETVLFLQDFTATVPVTQRYGRNVLTQQYCICSVNLVLRSEVLDSVDDLVLKFLTLSRSDYIRNASSLPTITTITKIGMSASSSLHCFSGLLKMRRYLLSSQIEGATADALEELRCN